MAVLVLYLSVFLLVGIYDYFRVKNFDDYVVAGRRQKQVFLVMSMTATMVGASATMGIASLAAEKGFFAFLWLGSGAMGLFIQSKLLSGKVRSLEVYTLPGLAEKCAGIEGKYITAVVIVVSWTGIIAAQFTALAGIASILTGLQASNFLIITCSTVIILYTAFGGQLSIIKTDAIQILLLSAGLLAAFFAVSAEAVPPALETGNFQAALSALFSLKPLPVSTVLHLIFIVGGAYFVGPDIFSRNFTADSADTAGKATFKAGFILLAFSIIITLTGTFAAYLAPGSGLNPYIYIISSAASPAAGFIISAGLLSAIISSTDTCIMTAAAIIEKDLIGKKNLSLTRVTALLTGFAALGIALFKRDILALLLGTYSVFSPGIVFPVFTAVYFSGKRRVNKALWLTAVGGGSLCGAVSAFTGNEIYALAGMGLSAALSLMSVRRKKEPLLA